MARFFLFVAVAWLVSKIVGLVFRSMTRPQPPQRAKENNFAEPRPNPQVEFKDVQDAQFTEIIEKEHVSK